MVFEETIIKIVNYSTPVEENNCIITIFDTLTNK